MKYTRTYVMADIHGRWDLLVKALTLIEIDRPKHKDSKIVVLGDFVDRGPNSKHVIEHLMIRPDIVTLMGNHEAMMLQTLLTPKQELVNWWVGNGGGATMRSYGHPYDSQFMPELVPSRHRTWLAQLPSYHEDEYRIYVHAGVNPNLPMDQQKEEDLHWLLYGTNYPGGSFRKGLDTPHISGKHLVHGHEQSATHPLRLAHRTNLDAFAWATGKLAIGVFNGPGGLVDVLWAEGEPM